MRRHVIIVAGGKGLRMGTATPKQFLSVAGKPILVHTLQRFLDFEKDIQVILVLPEDHFNLWSQISVKYFPHRKIDLVVGGSTRFQSVKNGLDSIESPEGIVAVHDAVRPMVTDEIIKLAFNQAKKKGTAVTAVTSKDSLRKLTANGKSASVPRNEYKIVQTPQIFDLKILRNAYECEEKVTFTDDASVVESAGYEIFLVEGSYQNIKITTEEDLILAETLLSAKS